MGTSRGQVNNSKKHPNGCFFVASIVKELIFVTHLIFFPIIFGVYFNEPVLLRADGPVKIIGPSAVSLKGGMGGTYIKTVGEEGEAVLHIVNMQAGEIKITFNIKVDRAPQI